MSDAVAQENDVQYWWDYRAALISQLISVERHKLGMQLTTADIRRWFRHRGPGEQAALKQLENIRDCSSQETFP